MHLAFIFFQKEALIGPLAITQHGASLSLAYSVLAQIMHLASGIKLAEMSLVHFILPCEEQNLKSPLYMIRIRLCTILCFSPEIYHHQWSFRSEREGMVIPGARRRRVIMNKLNTIINK